MKRTLALILSLVLLVTMFAGCGSSSSSTAISACIGSEPKTLDPNKNNSLDGGTYINCAFEGLTAYNKDCKVVGAAAEKWETSADGLVWTFHIRKDAKWSDGKDVTAKDFVYSWRRLADPKTAADYAYYTYFIKNGEEINTKDAPIDSLGVKAIDDKTLEVTLVAAAPFFTEVTAFPALVPLREDIVSANNEKWSLDSKSYIGNGPYVLSNWEHDSKLTFEKNDKYWGKDTIKAPKIEWLLMSDENAILGAFKNNQIQVARGIPVDELAAEKTAGTLQILPQIGTYYLNLVNNKAPFDNPKVRKAVSLAIDRNYIVEKVTKGGQKPASAYVPFGIADVSASPDFRTKGGDFYSVKQEDLEKNIAEAKKLLAEAGYPDGKGFPKVTYGINTGGNHQVIAEAVQQMLKKNLNIEIEVQAQEWNVFQDSRKTQKYNISRDGWVGDYMDASTFMDMFTSTNGQNNSKYNNPKYDEAIKAARVEKDPAKRIQIFHDAEKLLLDDMGICPLYFYTDPLEISKSLDGFVETPLGFIYLQWASIK